MEPLEDRRGTLVEVLAAGQPKLVVERLADEGVAELVDVARLAQESQRDRLVHRVQQRHHVDVQELAEHVETKPLAQQGGGSQQALREGTERGHPASDHLPDALGYAPGARQRAGIAQVAALGPQLAHDLLDEEGVAGGL